MAEYIQSDYILVFPSARRANKQVTARLVSEDRVAGLTYQLIDTAGYVTTEDVESGQSYDNIPISFNIHGYNFTIDKGSHLFDIMPQGSLNIYANIYLDKTSEYIELKGQDDPITATPITEDTQFVFKGVSFSATKDTSADYSLLILKRMNINSSWYIPKLSRIKFKQPSLDIDIDGGEII